MVSFKVAILNQDLLKMELLVDHVLDRILEIEKMMDKPTSILEFDDIAKKFIEQLDIAKSKYNLETNFISTVQLNQKFYGVAAHGIMTLEELMRNAIKNGATKFVVNVDESDTHIIWKFKDNGNGMPQQTLIESGLKRESGISHIRKLALVSGGLVRWDSIENLGTVCTVYLRKAD